MTHEESLKISAAIGNYITGKNPIIACKPEDIEREKASYGEEELAEMREIGLLGEDFEQYCIIREFCEKVGLGDIADGEYILKLFENAKHLDPALIENDPFMKAIQVKERKKGRFLLTNAEYAPHELFLYDMPDFSADIVTPKIGFFSKKVRFPTLYEGAMPWISVCPSEVLSMREQIGAAHGRCLVLGLGLGYYAFHAALEDEVERITIVELSETVIEIFRQELLPHFPHREKIRIIKGDAIAFLNGVNEGEYDFCFADIWEGVIDGLPLYQKIRPHEKRLPKTQFTYWLEPQLKYMDEQND